MLRFIIDPDNEDDMGRLELVQGDHGVIPVEFIGDAYIFEEGDQLILNVRQFPNEESPLIFSSVNETMNVRINCEDTKNVPAGKYSAQLYLHKVGMHCPVEIWPDMNGSPNPDKCLKNFIIQPGVKGNG